MCQWSGIVDATLRESCILRGSKKSLKRPSRKGSWLWFAAKLSSQVGATLGPRSWTSIARAGRHRIGHWNQVGFRVKADFASGSAAKDV